MKEVKQKYGLSVHSLINKKKNAGIKGNLKFRYAN